MYIQKKLVFARGSITAVRDVIRPESKYLQGKIHRNECSGLAEKETFDTRVTFEFMILAWICPAWESNPNLA